MLLLNETFPLQWGGRENDGGGESRECGGWLSVIAVFEANV